MQIASDAALTESLRRHLGIEAIQIRRQLRWRPTWFVDAQRGGERIDVVVRGERGDAEVFPLSHEVKFHRRVAEAGLAVPAVHGWLDDLQAVVLERVPGKPDFNGVAGDERDTVVDEYLQFLAQLHAMDPEPFLADGIFRAGSGLGLHDHLERTFRANKLRPDPFIEFCLGWLRRNAPDDRGREAPIVWDSGQFHHAGGHLAGVLDLEFASIGDPMHDLAVWRMRDTLIPFGDFDKLYARYEDLSGTPIDMDAIFRYHFAATLSNHLIFGRAVADPQPHTDLMTYMQWTSETDLHATEALAEFYDIDLPEIELPEPIPTRSDPTFAHLVRWLGSINVDDDVLQHELRLAFRMARHLERTNEIGRQLEADDLDDVARLLGYRPASWGEADAALEKFVLADNADGSQDRTLVELFHRRNLRRHATMGPPGSSMTAHYPTQRFR